MAGKIIAVFMLGFLSFSPPDVTLAQGHSCVAFDAVRDQLETRYQERPAAVGIGSTGRLLTVFASKDGRTWTVVETWPNGCSGVLAAGESWQLLVAPIGEQS